MFVQHPSKEVCGNCLYVYDAWYYTECEDYLPKRKCRLYNVFVNETDRCIDEHSIVVDLRELPPVVRYDKDEDLSE